MTDSALGGTTFHSPTDLDKRSYGLHFRVRCEILYDRRRAAFFERWSGAALVIAGIGSSSAWMGVLPVFPMWVAPVGGFVATMAIILNVVSRAAQKGFEHRMRARDFLRFAEKLMPLRNFDDEEYAALNAEGVALLESAPPTKELLAMECYNSTLLYYGHTEPIARYDFLKRFTKNLFSWDEHVREKLSAA